MGVQGVVLEHQADAPVLRREACHIVLSKEDLTGRWLFQAADQVQGGALAAAGGAQQADELAVRNFKVEVVDGDDV